MYTNCKVRFLHFRQCRGMIDSIEKHLAFVYERERFLTCKLLGFSMESFVYIGGK